MTLTKIKNSYTENQETVNDYVMEHLEHVEDIGILYISDEDYDWLTNILAENDRECLEMNFDDPDYCD